MVLPLRQQAHQRHPGIRARVHLTVVDDHILGRLPQVLRHAEQVLGVEENILPVDAAFPALDTVELEGLIRPYFEAVVMIYDMF